MPANCGEYDQHIQTVSDRLAWAEERITRFKIEASLFLATRPARVVQEVARHQDQVAIVYRLVNNADPPDSLRFSAGEIVNHLRSSIDNLMYIAGQRSEASDRLSLAIHSDHNEYRRWAKRHKLHLLPSTIQSWAMSQQQFDKQRKENLVACLNRLWNEDKHRKPIIVTSSICRTGLTAVGGGLFAAGRVDKADPSVVAFAHGSEGEMRRLIPQFTISIGIRNGNNDASEYLSQICEHVKTVIVPLFARAFDTPSG